MFGAKVAAEVTKFVMLFVVEMNTTLPSTGFEGKVTVRIVRLDVGGAMTTPEQVSVMEMVSPDSGVA